MSERLYSGRHAQHEPEWCWELRALAWFLVTLGLVLFCIALVCTTVLYRPPIYLG